MRVLGWLTSLLLLGPAHPDAAFRNDDIAEDCNCLNGGACLLLENSVMGCRCPNEFDGNRCQRRRRNFSFFEGKDDVGPLASDEVPAPTGETISPAPVGETVSPAPVGETVSPAPVGETVSPAPVGETVSPAPVGETVSPAPVGETVSPAPVGETVSPAPVGETVSPAPVGETVSPAPVGETVSPAPMEGGIVTPTFPTVEPALSPSYGSAVDDGQDAGLRGAGTFGIILFALFVVTIAYCLCRQQCCGHKSQSYSRDGMQEMEMSTWVNNDDNGLL